jgi:hypothetical protein
MVILTWLSIGVKVDRFNIFNYQVDGLYIKLDKKLILKAQKIYIPKSKKSPSFGSVDQTFNRVKYLLTFFELIHLKEIDFNNNELEIYFKDNILQLSTKEYLIRGKIHREGSVIKGEIPMLYLKEKNVTLKGNFTYYLKKNLLNIEAKYAFKKIIGTLKVEKNRDKISFLIQSDTFSDLRSIIDQFSLHPTVKAWIVDKVQAKQYKLHYLKGEGELVEGVFKLNMQALKGEILFQEVKIYFNEKLPPILAPQFLLQYTDKEGLYFDLKDPRYLGKDLNGSSVSIVKLRDENTTLKLNLKIRSQFDKKVKTLLEAYHITMPILQKSGTVFAFVDIDLGLKKSHLHVTTDVEFHQGEVEIQKVLLPIESGNLHYEEGMIKLNDIVLKHENYEGILGGTLNLKKRELQAKFNAKSIRIGNQKKPIFALKNKKIPFTLSYKKWIKVDVPSLNAKFEYKNKKATLKLSNLYKIQNYLSDMIPVKEGGSATLETSDFKTYFFKGNIKRSNCVLYVKPNSCALWVPFYGKASANNVTFHAFGKKVFYNKRKSRFELNGIHIDLKKFLEQKSSTTKKQSEKLVLLGKNSYVKYGQYLLVTDNYDVEIFPNGDVKAKGSIDNDRVTFTKIKDEITLEASRIKDRALHSLIHFKGLKNGRYSITKKGDPKKVMKGKIMIEGGVMKDFKAYSNTLAFLNTLPALATFQDPGYSTKGFEIELGIINYRMLKSEKIIFDSIYIRGKSTTIIGKGELNLKEKTLHIELGIQVARALGDFIGSIPLVGYILVGEDKSATLGLTIKGSFDKPEVEVSAAKDILSYPLKLIQRTFESPKHLFSTHEKEK